MYEAIERHAADFNNLQNLLADPSGSQRLIAIEQALQQSAQAVGEGAVGNDLDRSNRSKIYQGMMAASRVIAQLREQAQAR